MIPRDSISRQFIPHYWFCTKDSYPSVPSTFQNSLQSFYLWAYHFVLNLDHSFNSDFRRTYSLDNRKCDSHTVDNFTHWCLSADGRVYVSCSRNIYWRKSKEYISRKTVLMTISINPGTKIVYEMKLRWD